MTWPFHSPQEATIWPGPVRRFYKSKANIDHRYDCSSVPWRFWDQTVDDMTGKRPCKVCKPSEEDEGPFCEFCNAYPAYGVGDPISDFRIRDGRWVCKICLTPELKLLLSLPQQIREIWEMVSYILDR